MAANSKNSLENTNARKSTYGLMAAAACEYNEPGEESGAIAPRNNSTPGLLSMERKGMSYGGSMLKKKTTMTKFEEMLVQANNGEGIMQQKRMTFKKRNDNSKGPGKIRLYTHFNFCP